MQRISDRDNAVDKKVVWKGLWTSVPRFVDSSVIVSIDDVCLKKARERSLCQYGVEIYGYWNKKRILARKIP